MNPMTMAVTLTVVILTAAVGVVFGLLVVARVSRTAYNRGYYAGTYQAGLRDGLLHAAVYVRASQDLPEADSALHSVLESRCGLASATVERAMPALLEEILKNGFKASGGRYQVSLASPGRVGGAGDSRGFAARMDPPSGESGSKKFSLPRRG